MDLAEDSRTKILDDRIHLFQIESKVKATKHNSSTE